MIPKTTTRVGKTKDEERRAMRKSRPLNEFWWASDHAKRVPIKIDKIVDKEA